MSTGLCILVLGMVRPMGGRAGSVRPMGGSGRVTILGRATGLAGRCFGLNVETVQDICIYARSLGKDYL